MVDMLQMDSREITKLLNGIQKQGPKFVRLTMRGYVNTLANDTKKKSEKVIGRKFNFSKKAAFNFTKKGVAFSKAKKSEKSPASIVGATGDLDSTNVKTRKASFLARQESGGTLKQIMSGGGRRKNLIAPVKGSKRKRLPRINKALYAKSSGTFGGNKRREFASAIGNARSNGLKRAFTPFGIYKVNKKSIKKLFGYHKPGSIKTPVKKWLLPSVKLVLRKRDQIFRHEVARQFEALGGKIAR